MATTEFIAAIELSSSKISGIAGKKNSDGSIQVLAYAREDASSFIHKGVIYNIDKTAQALTSIINKLESQLNNSIAKVYVGIGGQSLRTVKNAVSRVLEEEGIISQELVDAISDENLEVPLMDMSVLDVAPQEYKIDNNLQADPVGVAGKRITGNFLNIVARASLKKNLEHSFEQAKVEIADLLIAPIALANAVLTESEMRSGCALVDFGADTTTVSVYKNNILRFLSVLPLGGNNITRDITALQMEEAEAEQLKLKYGDMLYEEEETETPAVCTLEDGRSIELNVLNDIIDARAEEILANVWNQLQLSGYEDRLLSGIIFTGGGANLKNMEDAFRKRSKVDKVKTTRFVHNTIHGFSDVLKKDGMQNTLLGLLAAGNENCCLQEVKPPPAASTVTPPKPVDMFGDDEALKEQEAAARAAKAQREKEEKERRERERKEKERKEKEEKKKKEQEFQKQFREMIQSLSAALNTGYSVENAFYETQKELKILYPPEARISKELLVITRKLRIHIPVEQVLEEFAEQVLSEDVKSFVTVFVTAKKSGGDMIGIIRNTANQIGDKIEVKREIDTMLAAKKYEFQIMSMVPYGIIAYMSLSFSDFMEELYGNVTGIGVMTLCLGIYVGAYYLGVRLLRIDV